MLRAACCPNKPRAGSQAETPLLPSHWRFLSWQSLSDLQRHQPLWPDLHPHSPAPPESSAHPSQSLLELLCPGFGTPLGLEVLLSAGWKHHRRVSVAAEPVSPSLWHFPPGVGLCCQGSWCVQPQLWKLLHAHTGKCCFFFTEWCNELNPPDCECRNRAHNSPVFMVY